VEEMILFSVIAVCSTVIISLNLFLEFKREEREHKDVVALSDLLQKELSKINELKTKLDALSLKVSLR
jgi:hypothetical protein